MTDQGNKRKGKRNIQYLAIQSDSQINDVQASVLHSIMAQQLSSKGWCFTTSLTQSYNYMSATGLFQALQAQIRRILPGA